MPLSFAQVASMVRHVGLLSDEGKRLPIVLANPSPAERTEGLVAEFRPLRHLRLLSLPELHPGGDDLWRFVVSQCPALAGRHCAPNSGRGPVYAFLGTTAPSRVLERWYHYQTRAYRATDKFTGGANRKLIRVDEWVVAIRRKSSGGRSDAATCARDDQ